LPDLLAELFSSRVRAAVLSLLLPRPHLAFSLTELSRRLGLPVSSLQHECYKLARLGLLRTERVGNTRRYRPDPAWPLLEALTALTVRALPPVDALAGAAEGVAGLEACWVSGALEARSEPLYLVVIGEIGLDDVDGVFARARVVVAPWESGRLELAYFRSPDWRDRVRRGDPFAVHLSTAPRIDARRFDGERCALSPAADDPLDHTHGRKPG
jgi:DNA-binding transcriptional ArsR family regulator